MFKVVYKRDRNFLRTDDAYENYDFDELYYKNLNV